MSNLAIIETPEEFQLAGNKLEYIVSGDPIENAGAFPFISFILHATLWNTIQENNYVIIKADPIPTEENHIILRFKDEPDNSGFQLPTPINAESREEYGLQIINAMKLNYYVAKYFAIYVDDEDTYEWELIFRERKKVNLESPYSMSEEGSLDAISTDGTDLKEYTNYEIGCMIYHKTGLISEIYKYPFPDMAVKFDIADFLKNLSTADFQFPAADIFNPHHNALIKYKTKFFERYGFPLEYKILTEDNIRYCLPGGVDKDMINNFLQNGISWYDDHISPNKKFLTWSKDNRKWKTSDIIRLYYFRNTEISLFLRYRLMYNNTSWGDWTNLAFPHPYTFDQTKTIIELLLDPEHFFTEEQLEEATKFQIYICDSVNGSMSETRNFTIDNELSDQRIQFVFANSYEIAYDTIFAYGKTEHDIDIENYNLLSIDKTKQQSRSERTEIFTIRSGFISFSDLFFWQEFIQSSKRYIIRENRRIPVRLLSSNIFMYKNKNYNFGIEIKIEIDDPDKYRTSIPDDAILFSDYFNQYGYSLNFISGIGNRHTIIDKNGNILPDKENLKFTGDGVNISDDTNITEINITDSLYFDIDTNFFATTLPSGNVVNTNVNLTSSISENDILIISGVQGPDNIPFSTKRYVEDIDFASITFSGAPILPEETTLYKIKHKARNSSIINAHKHTLLASEWSNQEQTIAVPDMKLHSLVFLAPANDSGINLDYYLNAGLMAIEQTPGYLKIKARNETPTNNINIKIIYIS